MTLLQAYLRSPKARRALSKRPGDAGFSLIELVVVVAILAILAAVALPNFLGVSKDGQIAAAKNTLATIVKECSVKETRTGNSSLGKIGGTGTEAPIQAASGNLNGYTLVTIDPDASTPETASDAAANDKITINSTQNDKSCYGVAAVPSTTKALPKFAITFTSGTGATAKTCIAETGTKYVEGCYKADGTTQAAGTAGVW